MSKNESSGEQEAKMAPPRADEAALLVQAKTILRTTGAGALATIDAQDGAPFASLVSVATESDGRLILLTSALSAHSRHMQNDPRVSILLAARGKGDPLAHPRLTVMGRVERTHGELRAHARARFLQRHPKSALYADFPDFSFWLVAPVGAHFNGGFAKAAQFSASDLTTRVDDAQGLLACEEDALAHLNADHSEALGLYARTVEGRSGGRWRAVALDPEGLDLAYGDQNVRIAFSTRVLDPDALRGELVALARRAREA